MKKLKTAVFGTGFMGRVHTEGIRRLGNVEVAAIAASSDEKARKFGEEVGVGRTTGDYRTVLRDATIDAVHICTPNALHFPMASAALEAGKHVLCEKPLAISVSEAKKLVELAAKKDLANCTFHNLRFYPMVQQIRRMRETGELGEIYVVQGTYSQDWLYYDTDWNWRIDQKANGKSRVMADIGSHWCDMIEHVTGLRITSLCADLQTFHKTRKKPKGSVAWDQEQPDALWIGHRNEPNQSIVKDPSLLEESARRYADLPGGHSEGYDDTFKQVFRRFYRTVADRSAPVEYPQFADGLRQLQILDKALRSSAG